jgi:hypothetical protein
VGDGIDGVYDDAAGGQSTLDIVSDTDASLTITDPAAGGVAVDAATYAIKGTAVAGYTVAIYADTVNDGVKTAGESKLGETTAAADGTWTIVVPLSQDSVNDFVATQRSNPALSDTGTGIQVPLITEGGGVNFTSTTSAAGGGSTTFLDPGDTITVVFSGDVTGVGAGDTWTIVDPDGSTATITCGGSGNADCVEGPAGTVTITITAVLTTSGGSAGIAGSGTITAVSGFTSATGAAIVLTGDRTFAVA